MSYCRWSSMNWRCDVYVYEDVNGGWTTHIARNRVIFPPPPALVGGRLSMALHRWSGAEWHKETRSFTYRSCFHKLIYSTLWNNFATFWYNRIHMGMLGLIPRKALNLPHDGESANHSSPGGCGDYLEYLKGLGYNVPENAIATLREEEETGVLTY